MGDDAAPTEGATTTTAAPGTGQQPQMSRAEREAADRAAFLAADLEADDAPAAGEPKPAAAPAKKPAPAADEDEDEDEDLEEDEDEDLEDEDEDDDLELDADDDDVDADEIDAPAPDDNPEVAKRMAAVRKAEQRAQAKAEARDKTFEQQKQAFLAEMKPKIEKAEAFDKIPKHDIAAILKAKGHTEEDFEDLARMLYGMSAKAAADPKNKEAVARMQRERELREEVAESKKMAKALEEKLTARDAEQQNARAANKYLARVTKSFGDDTPLANKRLELAPKAIRRELAQLAYELSEKRGEAVDAKTVARAYEKRLGKQVERARALAGDAPAAAAAKPGVARPAPKPAAGVVKPAIKVIDKTPAAAVAPKKSVLPSRDKMIEGLARLDRGEEVDPDELD